METTEDSEPLKILVLDTNAHRRAVRAHGLASFGHHCEQAWSFDQAAGRVMPGRIDALLGAVGPGQLPLRGYGQLFERFGPVRQTALVALTAKFVHGQAESLLRAGFDVALHEPTPIPVVEKALRDAALPLRPPPPLDHAQRALIRAERGEAALEALEQKVQEAAERVVAAFKVEDPVALAATATVLAEACAAAGMPAAAEAARQLAYRPERPYLQRALANAMGGARTAARTERMRRAAAETS